MKLRTRIRRWIFAPALADLYAEKKRLTGLAAEARRKHAAVAMISHELELVTFQILRLEGRIEKPHRRKTR